METFEWTIMLLFGAALLSGLAGRLSLPYPSLLALGGAAIALLPFHPEWTLDPRLALTLFVAPVLLDAAYDSSPRDLMRNWRALVALAFFSVIITTACVAIVVKALVPEMGWAAAIALGAIVAPPDAAAATAVIRRLPMPHKLRTMLEGESLINDASALLIYRFAIVAAASGSFGFGELAPQVLLTLFGSVIVGASIGWLFLWFNRRVFTEVSTAVIAQFTLTFGLWILSENLGLSGILTIVANAVTVARLGRLDVPARIRVPTLAIWETVVFILNAFAFVLIGMQVGPIWARLAPNDRVAHLGIALAVLATVVAARFAWVFVYSFAAKRFAFDPYQHSLSWRQVLKGCTVLSWTGMRGIVTLAAALAVPLSVGDGTPFPYRDLIMLCAFTTVLGTLVLQGLTLGPLIKALKFPAENPVNDEVVWARSEAYGVGLRQIEMVSTEEADAVRRQYGPRLDIGSEPAAQLGRNATELRKTVLDAARGHANELRLAGMIGDEAFRVLEAELDWAELEAESTQR